MSITVMTAVWPLPLSPLDKLALLALADNANDLGECYPSLTALTEKCGMSRRALIYCLQRLEAAGHVSRKCVAGKRTVYTVHPCMTCTSAGDAPVHDVRRTSAPDAPLPLPLKPSPSENRQEPSVERVRVEPPPSNLEPETWHRWEQYRKQIRKPIKPASVAAAQRKLAGFGPNQAAVVEQSIANGWQGLFPLKELSKTKTQENSGWR